MKRQRGRNRGGSSGGKPQQQNANRAFDSNGPEGVKVRGNAQTVFEKYQQLARDAGTGGDRVLAENYLQHAEHYFRTLRAMQPQRSASEILGRDQYASSFDMLDFEDETGGLQQAEADANEAEASDGQEGGEARDRSGYQNRDERQDRQERYPRDDRPRNDNQSQNRNGQSRWRDRDDRPRDDRPRDDRPRDERPRDERPRDERPRDDRPREDRPPRAERQDRDQQRHERSDPLAVVEPQQSAPLAAEAPARPSPVLRDAEGGESHAPAFLQARPAAAPAAEGDEPVRKPRRRRAPRSFEGGDGGSAAPESEDA
jgi:hypothetical protein